MLISFEGLPGAGKTTQSVMLADRLSVDGYQVAYLPDLITLTTDDAGERLFDLFASSGDPFMRHDDVLTDTYLAAAIRANIVATCIEPALKSHQVVIEDRGVHTMYSYSLATILRHHRIDIDAGISWLMSLGTLAGRQTDLALRLRLPVAEAIRRAQHREGADWNAEQQSFLAYVHQAYDELDRHDATLISIDAEDFDRDRVHNEVLTIVNTLLREQAIEPSTLARPRR
jgi:dTMP kinase